MAKVTFDSEMLEKSKSVVFLMTEDLKKIIEICDGISVPSNFSYVEYVKQLPNIANDYVTKLNKAVKWLNRSLSEYEQLEREINCMADKLETMKINTNVFKQG